MQKADAVAWTIVCAAVLAGIVAYMLPGGAGGASGELQFHLNLMLAVIAAALQIGAAVMFLWGFRGFRQQLKGAYAAICTGIVLLGFAQLQVPMLTYFNLGESFYVTSGLVVVPFVAPMIFIFFGTRYFAKLFGVKTLWASFWFTTAVASIAAMFAVGLGLFGGAEDVQFLATVGLSTWTSFFLVSTSLMTLRMYRTSGILFHEPLRWFGVGNATLVVTGLLYVGSLLALGPNNPIATYGGTIVPSVAAGLLFIRAGYGFIRMNESSGEGDDMIDVSLVDIVTFVTSQVSNPAQIGRTLETLRAATVDLKPGVQINPEQEKSLRQAYMAIEQHLVEKDSIRQLTAEQVRHRVAENFGISYETLLKKIGVSSDQEK